MEGSNNIMGKLNEVINNTAENQNGEINSVKDRQKNNLTPREISGYLKNK